MSRISFLFVLLLLSSCWSRHALEIGKNYIPVFNPGGVLFDEDESFAQSYEVYEQRRHDVLREKARKKRGSDPGCELGCPKVSEEKRSWIMKKLREFGAVTRDVSRNNNGGMVNKDGIDLSALPGARFIDIMLDKDDVAKGAGHTERQEMSASANVSPQYVERESGFPQFETHSIGAVGSGGLGCECGEGGVRHKHDAKNGCDCSWGSASAHERANKESSQGPVESGSGAAAGSEATGADVVVGQGCNCENPGNCECKKNVTSHVSRGLEEVECGCEKLRGCECKKVSLVDASGLGQVGCACEGAPGCKCGKGVAVERKHDGVGRPSHKHSEGGGMVTKPGDVHDAVGSAKHECDHGKHRECECEKSHGCDRNKDDAERDLDCDSTVPSEKEPVSPDNGDGADNWESFEEERKETIARWEVGEIVGPDFSDEQVEAPEEEKVAVAPSPNVDDVKEESVEVMTAEGKSDDTVEVIDEPHDGLMTEGFITNMESELPDYSGAKALGDDFTYPMGVAFPREESKEKYGNYDKEAPRRDIGGAGVMGLNKEMGSESNVKQRGLPELGEDISAEHPKDSEKAGPWIPYGDVEEFIAEEEAAEDSSDESEEWTSFQDPGRKDNKSYMNVYAWYGF